MQALVRVWGKTQLILKTQQECTLVQTVLLRASGKDLREDSRSSRGQETQGKWLGSHWTLAQAVISPTWIAVAGCGGAGSIATPTTLVQQSSLNVEACPAHMLACL